MKDKRNYLLLLLPIIVFVSTFLIVTVLNKKSYASEDTTTVDRQNYAYIRRNMLSHHFITSNSNPSGTILLKTGNQASVEGNTALAYCAHKGKNIAASGNGHWYTNVPIDETKVSVIKKHASNLKGVIANSYPYISLGELKTILEKPVDQGGLGADYSSFGFDTLDVQEAMTATQAAIWNAIDGSVDKGENKLSNWYRTTKNVGRVSYRWFHNKNNKTRWIYWDNIDSYNITEGCYNGIGSNYSCGVKSTILQTGDTAESAGSYKKSGAGNRINRLIKWYSHLSETSVTNSTKIPDYYVVNSNFNADNTVDVFISNNGTDSFYPPSSVVFTDSSNNTIAISNQNQETISGVTGIKYKLSATTTNEIKIKVAANVTSSAINTYVYETNVRYSSTQYLIGGQSGSVPIEKTLEITRPQVVIEKGKLRLFKTGLESGGTTGIVSSDICGYNNEEDKQCLPYATFAIYKYNESHTDSDSNLVTTFISDLSYTEIELDPGKYYLREISSPAYYKLNSTPIDFTITKDATIRIQVNNVLNKLCIKKLDKETNQPVTGAKFYIEEVSSGEIYENFVTSTVNSGVYCVDANLETGYYYITEIETPSNYIKNFTRYKVNVGNYDGTVEGELAEEFESLYANYKVVDLTPDSNNTVTIYNEAGVAMTKSDLTNGQCVAGAKLTIKDLETNEEIANWISTCKTLDDEGNEIGEDNHKVAVCNADGTNPVHDASCRTGSSDDDDDDNSNNENCSKCLVRGRSYTLTETMTEKLQSQGYSSEAETITFEIGADGKVTKSLDMKDMPIQVCIYKVEKGTTNPLPGATFNLYKEDGTLYKTITTTKTPSDDCLTRIPIGKYTIKEIKAPDGYKVLNEEIEIVIKDTKDTQYFYIENEVIAPKTALDNTKILMIISAVLMIFGVGMVGYYVARKKQ